MTEHQSGLGGYIRLFFQRRFNLHLDKANEEEVVRAIKANTVFVGSSLWTLIFAIFIASIGLNVNSTAVIIGAMLISPLMGPIIGIGLGIGINDLALVRQGGRNLLIAALISIATSTLYFYITPLHDAQSELLARTTPSIWDVFIAFVGGLAGAIAVTRKEKSNVIPGVAIATALMPPLCTAGFGLASGNLLFFAGAIYLFFINSLFICISTYLIVRFLKFNKKYFEDRNTEKKVSRYILITVLVTIIPSIYLAYGIVQKSIFENSAQKFIREEFSFSNTQVVNKSFKYSRNSSEIDLLLIGAELSKPAIDSIRSKLASYKLKGTQLIIRQGLDARANVDFSQIKASIMEDVFSRDSLAKKNVSENKKEVKIPEIREEIKSLFPVIKSYSVASTVFINTDTLKTDTVLQFTATLSGKMPDAEKNRVEKWLKARLRSDKLKVVLE
ncbi:TIGR00341 family protein [Pedobacter miscanthi]|uniref:TIGR00341 family protein n=1 Tax=Pedobacter miscanthi TaxID=2259170 RepID=A0A366L570_9SPHI|nr:TIGR00341 family protein [Pedobacter miscanthi]RBQ08930.1 TIGR00341 family protein [Pedobacter miscanthi]